MSYLKILVILSPIILSVVYVLYSDSKNIDEAVLYSSVFCRGSNHTNRLCHFQNLCYEPNSSQFIFFHSFKSLKLGIPIDRFSPTLLDFSSVSDHNTQFFNYIDFPSSNTSIFNITFIQGNALVLKRFNPDNLMHVFHDDLIPIFTTLKELSFVKKSRENIFLVFADTRQPGPYAELYNKFLSLEPLYLQFLPKNNLYCFENMHVGLSKETVWYQYGFKEPQGSIQKQFTRTSVILHHFREYFLQQFSLFDKGAKNCSVMLVRKQTRIILNEAEVLKMMSQTSGLKTHAFSLEELSILDLIKKILSCRMMLGMHGSLLVLSLFLQPQSIVIELFPFGVNPNISTAYLTLSKIMGHTYQPWENVILSNTFPHPEYPSELGGVQDLSDDERTQIQNSIVHPFLCCSDPVWLYRIYQDTYVDIDSLKEVVEFAMLKNSTYNNIDTVIVDYFPSEVQNIECFPEENPAALVLKWDVPWNLLFIDNVSTEYEVWIQNIHLTDVQAFLMKRNNFKYIVKSEKNSLFYVWIRCLNNGLAGPFNSVPHNCSFM